VKKRCKNPRFHGNMPTGDPVSQRRWTKTRLPATGPVRYPHHNKYLKKD